MIIISYKPGQLANRLVLFSHLYAFALVNNHKIYNPSLNNYAKYFDCKGYSLPYLVNLILYVSNWVFFSIANFIARLLVYLNFKENAFFKVIYLDYDQNLLLEPIKNELEKKIVFAHGWGIRSASINVKRAEVLKYFTLKKLFIEEINNFFANNNLTNNIIAVHVRRGDYVSFEGGKFYYSDEQYIAVISKAIEHYNGGCSVVICSNEKIDLEKYSKSLKTNVISGPGGEITDLYFMSKVSLIIGPPSTYSIWASFVGNVPLFAIKNPNDTFNYNAVKIYDHL